MKLDLQYRETSYFNETDYFICDNTLNGILVTKLEFAKNGFWYTKESLNFRVTSIRVQNANEVYSTKVKLKGLDYHGTLCKCLGPVKGDLRGYFGILWDGGLQVKKHGLQKFWNKTSDIEF